MHETTDADTTDAQPATALQTTDDPDLVTVPVRPPRDAGCYRATKHFKQRLNERIPSRHHGPVPRDIVEQGAVTRRPFRGITDADDPGHPVAFVGDVDGDTYTVIAALRPAAYRESDTVHDLLTVYPNDVTQSAAGDQTGVDR